MKIRKCRTWRTANGPEWRHLDSICFPTDRHFRNGPGYRWWGTRDDDERLVGYAGLWLDGKTAHLTRCGVHPSSRGNGIQRALIAARVRWCRTNGIGLVRTYTSADNAQSSANLSAAGFKRRRVKDKEGEWLVFTLCL